MEFEARGSFSRDKAVWDEGRPCALKPPPPPPLFTSIYETFEIAL